MDEDTYRRVNLGVGVAIAIFTAGLFWLALAPHVSGLPIPAELLLIVGALVVFGGVLGWYTFPSRRVLEYLARRVSGTPAPSELTGEAIALVETAMKSWGTDGAFIDSFGLVSLNILNELNRQMGKVSPAAGVFIQEANGIVNGWKAQRPVVAHLVADLDSMAGLGLTMDSGTLVSVVETLYSLSAAGSNLANLFVQAVSNSQNAGAALNSYRRREWGSFSSRANRLGEDLGKLSVKIRTATGVDLQVHVTTVGPL